MHRVYRESVLRMLNDGKPLRDIEDEIDGMDIDDDAKAVLWLIAYSGQTKMDREVVIAEAGGYGVPPQG